MGPACTCSPIGENDRRDEVRASWGQSLRLSTESAQATLASFLHERNTSPRRRRRVKHHGPRRHRPALRGLRRRGRRTGTDALKAAETFRPDLMVLDIMLPDRDGFHVVQRLRADGRHVPVVFLTARDSTEEKVKGLTVGGDDYVTKPFSLEELVARVPRRAPPDRRRDQRRRLGPAGLRRPRARRRHARGVARPHPHRADADRVQAAALPHAQRAPRACRSRRSSTTSGSTTSTATPTSSRRTSATCARRSTSSGPPLIHTIRGVGYTLRTPPEG